MRDMKKKTTIYTVYSKWTSGGNGWQIEKRFMLESHANDIARALQRIGKEVKIIKSVN